jgi:hypothetical protein
MFFDGRPCLRLWWRRCGKGFPKPTGDRWMKYLKVHREGNYNSDNPELHK